MSQITYGEHERNRIWVGSGARPGGRWLVVIHGGIWQHEATTEQDGIPLARALAHCFQGVASIDYRLSPEVVHPDHWLDCRLATLKLCETFAVKELVFAGHSAGAFLSGQIASLGEPLGTPIVGVIGLEGLYDLNDLVDEYPQYRHYLSTAFGPQGPAWTNATPKWSLISSRLLILHSAEDELVSLRQPRLLRLPQSRLIVLKRGTHDKIFAEPDLLDIRDTILPWLDNL